MEEEQKCSCGGVIETGLIETCLECASIRTSIEQLVENLNERFFPDRKTTVIISIRKNLNA